MGLRSKHLSFIWKVCKVDSKSASDVMGRGFERLQKGLVPICCIIFVQWGHCIDVSSKVMLNHLIYGIVLSFHIHIKATNK